MFVTSAGQASQVATPPPPPAAPATPQATVQSPLFSTAADVYQGILAQRRVILRQIESLQDRREEIVQRLRQGAASDADRAGLDQQLAQVDQQIAAANINLAEVEGRLATAAAVPGATVPPPEPDPWRNGPPEEVVMMTIVMGSMLLLPVMIAYARRIWRRSAKTEVTLPPVLVDRMESLERSMDAVAIEVERIGEGQRFVTQLLADRAKAAALPSERSGGPGSGR
jgi:hypothetical protein